MVEISVILCTYNRVDRLKDCLKSLFEQSLDHNIFEIIIIDNGSDDGTSTYISEFQNEKRIKYYYESNLGLSFARNRGIKEASGKWFAFIDDDAKADNKWLQTAHDLINSLDPSPDCLGGPILPYYTTPKPIWFEDKYEIRSAADSTGYLRNGVSFSGSNMIWKRESMEQVGNFDVTAGMVGEKLRLGEETDAFNRLWRKKNEPKLYYSQDLIVYHWVPDNKMKVNYRLKRKYIEGKFKAKQAIITHEKNKFGYFFNIFKSLLKSLLRTLVKSLSYKYFQNWAIEEGTRIAIYLGSTIGFFESIFLSKFDGENFPAD